MGLRWKCVDEANLPHRRVLSGQRDAWHRVPVTIKSKCTLGLEKCWCKWKKIVDAKQKKRVLPLCVQTPSLSLSSLSLSLTWDCKPLAHCSKDHEAPHRQHDLHIFPRITTSRAASCHEPSRWRGGKRPKKRTAEMVAKLERESAKHLMMRVLSSLPLSRPLSSGQQRYWEFGFAYQYCEKMNPDLYGGDNQYRR